MEVYTFADVKGEIDNLSNACVSAVSQTMPDLVEYINTQLRQEFPWRFRRYQTSVELPFTEPMLRSMVEKAKADVPDNLWNFFVGELFFRLKRHFNPTTGWNVELSYPEFNVSSVVTEMAELPTVIVTVSYRNSHIDKS